MLSDFSDELGPKPKIMRARKIPPSVIAMAGNDKAKLVSART
jgi:hypothetical protein